LHQNQKTMKKLVTSLSFFLFLSFSAISQEAPLENYVGKFVFPADNPVPYVEVKLNGTTLMSESPMGSATLQRIEADQFSIVEYNGLAEFKRNGEGKVIGVKISVMGLEMEGKKEESIPGILFPHVAKLIM
jgi:hypothetical protein